jgi:hypothetical protein
VDYGDNYDEKMMMMMTLFFAEAYDTLISLIAEREEVPKFSLNVECLIGYYDDYGSQFN